MLDVGFFLHTDCEDALLEVTDHPLRTYESDVNLVAVYGCGEFFACPEETDTEETDRFVFTTFGVEEGRDVGEEVVGVLHFVILCYSLHEVI